MGKAINFLRNIYLITYAEKKTWKRRKKKEEKFTFHCTTI